MNDQFNNLFCEVDYEKQAIEETLKRLNQVLRKYNSQKASLLYEPALGTYLMNFYNGIENIIKRIAKGYYRTIPKSANWHKDLLLLSVKPPKGKKSILKHDSADKLIPYLKFRHRFISGYGFQLEERKMTELVNNAKPLWLEIIKQLDIFFEKL